MPEMTTGQVVMEYLLPIDEVFVLELKLFLLELIVKTKNIQIGILYYTYILCINNHRTLPGRHHIAVTA